MFHCVCSDEAFPRPLPRLRPCRLRHLGLLAQSQSFLDRVGMLSGRNGGGRGRRGLCTDTVRFVVQLQRGVAEQVPTQIRRHNTLPAGRSDGVSSVCCSLRHRWLSSSSIAAETSTPCRQKLGDYLVARQRNHVSCGHHLVATQPPDACSSLCCWSVN